MATKFKQSLQLTSVRDKLFPHTPIEVKHEADAGQYFYHIYMEGEWHSKVSFEDEVVRQVHWLAKTYGDDWYYPSTRVAPDWEGWKQISQMDLSRFREGAE
jgi:hypothetical protein